MVYVLKDEKLKQKSMSKSIRTIESDDFSCNIFSANLNLVNIFNFVSVVFEQHVHLMIHNFLSQSTLHVIRIRHYVIEEFVEMKINF